jgi:GNAT superfamily N-acetyltransferase
MGAARAYSTLAIRKYRATDSVAEITTLLHDAYAELARAGFRYLATHQSEEVTARRLSRGAPLIAEMDGRIVGTVTLYPSREDHQVEWYRRPDVCYFAQFGVSPNLQKQGIGVKLLRAIEDQARLRGAAELACDTAEGAAHLRSWYAREGFRQVGTMDWPETNYISVVLSKTLEPLGLTA